MPADASTAQSRPSGAGSFRFWGNGWGARLILVGSILSFLTLYASWTVGVSTWGTTDLDTDTTGITKYWVFHPGDTVSGSGDAFDRDFAAALFFTALMGLSAYLAVRSPRPGQEWTRWVPLLCTAVLLVNATDIVFQLGHEADAYGNGSTIRGLPGVGPVGLFAAQVVSGIGGLMFLRTRRMPTT